MSAYWTRPLSRFRLLFAFLCFFGTNAELELIELRLIDKRGSVEHDVATGVVLGEGDAVADAVEPSEEADEAVEAVGESAMRGRTVFKRVHEEAKLLLRTLGGEAEGLEDLGLQLRVVDSDGASAHFNAIAHHVVGIGADG